MPILVLGTLGNGSNVWFSKAVTLTRVFTITLRT